MMHNGDMVQVMPFPKRKQKYSFFVMAPKFEGRIQIVQMLGPTQKKSLIRFDSNEPRPTLLRG